MLVSVLASAEWHVTSMRAEQQDDGLYSHPMDTAGHLVLDHVEAYRYRIPLKRAYGTARGKTTASTNFVVAISVSMSGETVTGYGECQPRHFLTGDGERDRSSAWRFLADAVDRLQGRELDVSTRETALESVRAVMADLAELASSKAAEIHGDRPFRGTLLGIEVAILDAVSRAMGLRLSELLGEQRQDIDISISTISTTTEVAGVAEKVRRQKRFPMTRLKGRGDLGENLDLLAAAAGANAEAGRSKSLWIDLNEAMNLESAAQFVRAAATKMAAGDLPDVLTIEGPLPKRDGVQLAELQRIADEIAADYAEQRDLTIEIMPDESMWDASDLEELARHGGTRAINIKAPKAGGLLPSLDLANAAIAANPDIKICIGGMLGTSELTAWALHNLARAMPRIDYLTTVPPRNVDPIASPESRYVSRESSRIVMQEGPGLGTVLDPAKLLPFLEDAYPEGARAALERAAAGGVSTDDAVRPPGADQSKATGPSGHAAKTDGPDRSSSRTSSAKSAGPRESWRVLVAGPAVQGVGYRALIERLATDRDISGWVRNRSDGTVEALLRGRRAAIDKALTKVHTGPRRAVVDSVTVSRSEIVPLAGFRVRDTVEVETPVGREVRRVRSVVSGAARRVKRRLSASSSSNTPSAPRASGDVTGTRPAFVSGVLTLDQIGELTEGTWSGPDDRGVRPSDASWLVERLRPGQLAVMMDLAHWPEGRLEISRQDRYSPEEFVARAHRDHCTAVLTSAPVSDPPLPVLTVRDSREALRVLAKDARSRYDGDVIGVTGTVGKSTTKNLLEHILRRSKRVLATPGNWNTIDGVAQTLTGLWTQPEAAVLEATIHGFADSSLGDHAGELMRPTMGIVTSIGSAHRDVAQTVEDTARVKGRLLESLEPNGTAVLHRDAPFFDYLRDTALAAGASKVVTFGTHADADYRLTDWTMEGEGSRVTASLAGQMCDYTLSGPGQGLVLNSLGSLAAAVELGCTLDDAIEAVGAYTPGDHVAERHELAVSGGTVLMIDDSMNATYLSMVGAFELLAKIASSRQGRKVAVLGQINFLGNETEAVHTSLAEPLLEAGVDVVLTTGAKMDGLRQALGSIHRGHADTPAELAELAWQHLEPGDTVLVKGSNRNTGFRKVPRQLMRLAKQQAS